MISRIRGELLQRSTERVQVMTTGGVGYELEIPLSVYERMPREGEDVDLRVYTVVRDDAITLFGFMDRAERELFSRLITASGVGPRLALSMMSALSPPRLVRAITEKDLAVLVQVPGVGKKTAERIGLELSDKLDDLALAAAGPRPEGQAAESAISALIALGHSNTDATSAVRKAIEESGSTDDPQVLIKRALALVPAAR